MYNVPLLYMYQWPDTLKTCWMFTFHRSRLGSQSQWLHWESESESESESGNVKEPLLYIEITTNDYYVKKKLWQIILILKVHISYVYNFCVFHGSILKVNCEIWFNHNDKFRQMFHKLIMQRQSKQTKKQRKKSSRSPEIIVNTV